MDRESLDSDIFWIIHFDLPSERGAAVPSDLRKPLALMRVKIWKKLQKLGCIPLSESVYRLVKKEQVDTLRELIPLWKKEYMKILDTDGDGVSNILDCLTGQPIEPRIYIVPLVTNKESYKSFEDQEADFLIEWLLRIQKSIHESLDKNEKEGKEIKKAFLYRKKDDYQLIERIAKRDLEDHPRFQYILDNIRIVRDLLYKLEHIIRSPRGVMVRIA